MKHLIARHHGVIQRHVGGAGPENETTPGSISIWAHQHRRIDGLRTGARARRRDPASRVSVVLKTMQPSGREKPASIAMASESLRLSTSRTSL